MGCIYSRNRKTAMRKNKAVTTQPRKKYLTENSEKNDKNANTPVKHTPEFTEQQKELVLNSWKIIKKDMNSLGFQMFLKLFASHPDVQNEFKPYKGLSAEDLNHSSQLRSHAIRVMGTVDMCLNCMSDHTNVQHILQELGAKHVMYTAKVDYMDLIGPQFIWAIQPVFGQEWTPDLEQAWSDLFKLIAHIMKAAMTF